jgi:hypothetical protein
LERSISLFLRFKFPVKFEGTILISQQTLGFE